MNLNLNLNNSVKNNVYGFVKCFWHLRFTPEMLIYNIVDDYDCEYEADPEYINLEEIIDWQTYYK
jgi:hypothetical protein